MLEWFQRSHLSVLRLSVKSSRHKAAAIVELSRQSPVDSSYRQSMPSDVTSQADKRGHSF